MYTLVFHAMIERRNQKLMWAVYSPIVFGLGFSMKKKLGREKKPLPRGKVLIKYT